MKEGRFLTNLFKYATSFTYNKEKDRYYNSDEQMTVPISNGFLPIKSEASVIVLLSSIIKLH